MLRSGVTCFAKGSSTLDGNYNLQLMLLPKEAGIPRYKSWAYLPQNEIALGVGRKMFYTDCHGKPANAEFAPV